ncbi:hypothetical protein BH24ACT13_BH24ACT13_03700 [soil metagenome]
MKTRVRLLRRSDHDVVFEMMADPEAVAMAAFTADDPTDRAAFDEHMERVLANRGGDYWAVTDGDGTLIGTIATFPSDDGNPEVTYWIARPHWGQGHASSARPCTRTDWPAGAGEGRARQPRVATRVGEGWV